jgi:hypothetical protein
MTPHDNLIPPLTRAHMNCAGDASGGVYTCRHLASWPAKVAATIQQPVLSATASGHNGLTVHACSGAVFSRTVCCYRRLFQQFAALSAALMQAQEEQCWPRIDASFARISKALCCCCIIQYCRKLLQVGGVCLRVSGGAVEHGIVAPHHHQITKLSHSHGIVAPDSLYCLDCWVVPLCSVL